MAEIVYTLCALTSVASAFLLLRSYRSRSTRLLLWSGLCFLGLSLNNAIMLADALIGPSIDLGVLRSGVALAALLVLLVGLVGEFQ